MNIHWYRLSIDLDPAGNPIGASYEVRVAERIQSIHVLRTPAPFASIRDTLEEVLEDLEGRFGIQLPLW